MERLMGVLDFINVDQVIKVIGKESTTDSPENKHVLQLEARL
jgi:hypothetical protein